MATTTSNLVCDNSTFANFKSWATAISNALGTTCAWTQANDTGQVVWTATVLTLTQVASSGGNSVYSYSSFTGPSPRIGMSVIITGFATSGNNVTATLTAVSGGASGTVTVATTTQGNETHAGSGTTTALAAVPSSTYVYEIWTQSDALASTFAVYMKFEYGFSTSTVNFRVTLGTGSSAGTISGAISLSAQAMPNAGSGIANVGGTLFPCYFAGNGGEFRMLMWNPSNNTNNYCTALVIERSKDTSGADTSEYVSSLWLTGANNNFGGFRVITSGLLVTTNMVSVCACGVDSTMGTGSFNGTVAAFPVFPVIGKVGNPMLGAMCCMGADAAENSIVTVASMYSSSHTYVTCKSGASPCGFTNIGKNFNNGANMCFLMRYE